MELKPCPFCGAEAQIAEYGRYSVYCLRQCVEQPIAYPSKEEAIKAWNRRAEDGNET